jgi:hypothetical protein
MCCFFTALVFAGPRLAALVWWLIDPVRWTAGVGGHFFVAFLGFLFMPWTLLSFIAVAPGGIDGFDFVIIGLGVLLDVLSYSGSLWGNRDYAEDYAY